LVVGLESRAPNWWGFQTAGKLYGGLLFGGKLTGRMSKRFEYEIPDGVTMISQLSLAASERTTLSEGLSEIHVR
jgi:hypothetical protein